MIRSIRRQDRFATFRRNRLESAMSEVEFDLLLDAVQTAIAPGGEDILAQTLPLRQPPPRAANDNRQSPAWPLIPFPEGWNAAC
jgi:hypothetical protein